MAGISIFFVIMPHTLVSKIDPVSTEMRPHAVFPDDHRLMSLKIASEPYPLMVNKHNSLLIAKKWESFVDLMPRA
jgi:hypothetical protein